MKTSVILAILITYILSIGAAHSIAAQKSNTKSTTAKVSTGTISFKGIPLDTPGVKGALQALCKENIENSEKECSFMNNREHIFISYGILSFCFADITLNDDESLLSVEVTGSKGAMYSMVEFLTEKHGKPVKLKTPVENKMGTKFEKEIFVWRDKHGSRITVETIYGRIYQGRILIESAKAIKLSKVAERMIREAVKDNL